MYISNSEISFINAGIGDRFIKSFYTIVILIAARCEEDYKNILAWPRVARRD